MKEPTQEQAMKLLSYIPERPDYQTWLICISAIGNTFDEQSAMNIIQSRFTDEKQNENYYKLTKRLSNYNYGSLVHLAMKNGYTIEKTHRNAYYKPFSSKGNIKHVQKIVTFEVNPENIYRFKDYDHQERAGIIEIDGNKTREQAEQDVLNEFPNAELERVFRIAINRTVINKNMNPNTTEQYSNYSALTNNFKNEFLSIEEIAESIKNGFAFLCCHLNADKDGQTYRKKENFLCSEFFAIDIDNENPKTKERLSEQDGYLTLQKLSDIPETKNAMLIYTTFNHSENWNRYRLLFPLPRLIKSADHFEKIVKYYINIYNSDVQCSDGTRAFYGNTGAEFLKYERNSDV